MLFDTMSKEKKTRILYLTSALSLGGAEQHLALLAQELNPKYFDIYLYCAFDKGVWAKSLEKQGIQVKLLLGGLIHQALRKYRKAKAPPLLQAETSAAKNPNSIRFLVQEAIIFLAAVLSCLHLWVVILVNRIDLISMHLVGSTWFGLLATRIIRSPKVYTQHSLIDSYLYTPSELARLKKSVQHVDRLIAVSQAVKKSCVDCFQLAPDQIDVVGHAVTFRQVSTSQATHRDQIKIVTLGRLAPVKGHTYFIQAAKCVVQKYPNAQFVIAGDGENRAQLHEEVNNLDLEDQVFFTGAYDNSQVPELLKDAWMVVAPSLSEALGIVVLEAMVCRVPVIATTIGGFTELIEDGVTGLLVKPADPAAIAKAILRLIEDAPLRDRIGIAGQQKVKSLAPEVVLQKTVEVYQKVLIA